MEARRRSSPPPIASWDAGLSARGAAEVYPLPKVTRPRVVRDPEFCEFKWSMGGHGLMLQQFDRKPEHYPRPGEGLDATRSRVVVWADLLANPTEEVDE